MPDFKLGFLAIASELGAWGIVTQSSWPPDAALLAYLVAHGLASLLAATFAITFLPSAKPRLATLALMASGSYAVPIFGFVGLLFGVLLLRAYRHRQQPAEFESLQLPEFDPHQHPTSTFRQSGLRAFLGNSRAPTSSRLGALVSLQYVPGRVASPLLREVLTDPSEDIRLLAYGMLDNKEKRINQAIDEELKKFNAAEAASPSAQTAARRLSDLYWELVYQELALGDLRSHALERSRHYCEIVLACTPDDAALNLRHGQLLSARGEAEPATTAYYKALALGLPSTRVLPYLAELRFNQGNYADARRLMNELEAWDSLPRLQPVIAFWSAK